MSKDGTINVNDVVHEVVSDVVRLEEKINALTERMTENTELTKENLIQLQEVRTCVRVIETKVQQLEAEDDKLAEYKKAEQASRREWTRGIVLALVSFGLGILATWLMK